MMLDTDMITEVCGTARPIRRFAIKNAIATNMNAPLTGRKTFMGSKSVVKRTIKSSVCRPWRTCDTELVPIRWLTLMGTHLTGRPLLSIAKVLVVENENPVGMR